MPVLLGAKLIPVDQPDATISLAPVSGAKNVVLDITGNVRLIGIFVRVTWTVQPSPLEIHGTIDGIPWIWTQANPVSNAAHFCQISENLSKTIQTMGATQRAPTRGFLLECRSIKIEAEITGGTVSNLECRVKYQRL